ncbi:MAG: regulatory protein ArsR [Ilumatobacteraceae bacterium]|nr:regulatory protein ArsR [Ilumatobacteraceae bacterium]
MLEALADPSRRAIVDLLSAQPASVTAIADALPVSRPAVSQHLKVLKEAGLVTDRPDGTRRIYTLQPDALEAVRAYFDDFWQRSLMMFRLAAEVSGEDSPTPTHEPQRERKPKPKPKPEEDS